jgi:hypothetical protein
VTVVHVEDDPILVQRAKALRIANLGQRIGYLLYAMAIVVFMIGLMTDFNGLVSAIVTFGVIAGSVVLAPAILGGYAVKAAVRDDLEHGRDIG